MTGDNRRTTSRREAFEALPDAGVALLPIFHRDGWGVGID